MKSTKEKVLEWIQALPDDCTMRDIQYQLHVRSKVEEGHQALDEGRVVTQEEAEGRRAQWLASYGQTQP